jgi:hypothetical protein
MSTSILSAVTLGLDLVVLERMAGSALALLTTPTPWFADLIDEASEGRPITISQAFPFLETFLSDAEAFWREQRSGQLRSGLFAAGDGDARHQLEAVAISAGSRRLLVIARPDTAAGTQTLLQRAREATLHGEALEKRLDAARKAARSLRQALDALTRTDLNAQQQQALDALTRAQQQLFQAIDPADPADPPVGR